MDTRQLGDYGRIVRVMVGAGTRTEVDRAVARIGEDEAWDFSTRHEEGHMDLPRMREGGLDAQFFAVWMGEQSAGDGQAVKKAIDQIDSIYEVARRNVDDLVVATSADGIRVSIQGEAKKYGDALDYIDNLEASPHFARVYPRSESVTEKGSIRFVLDMEYDPGSDGPAEEVS